MMLQSRKLNDIGVLDGLPADQLQRLGTACVWRAFERGVTIVDADMESTDVYFLVDGRVRITFFSSSGREVAFRELDAGGSFGELAAVDGLGRSATVIALETCTVAVIACEQFWKLMYTHPQIAANVLRRFATLIRDLTARVVDTTTLTVPERVRAVVVRQARTAGVVANRATIKGFTTHADLASQIGATREAVSRELSRLSGEGLIERDGRNLIVPDFEVLRAAVVDRA